MNKQDLIIVGAGGHSQSLTDAIVSDNKFRILGIVDKTISDSKKEINGIRILGDDSLLLEPEYREIPLCMGLGSIKSASCQLRKKLFELFSENGHSFPTIIHPNSIVSKYAKIMPGAQIMAGAVIQTNAVIKNNVIINASCVVEHGSIVEAHSALGPGAILCGETLIGAETHIGAGAVVNQCKKIGNRVTIGSGAVVTSDIPDDSIAVGIPARVL